MNESMPRVRVAAVIVRENALLLAEHERSGRRYHVLPGGGVDFGETLSAALARELKEECNIEIRVGNLVLVHDSIPPDGRRHIVNLYFNAEITAGELRLGEGDKRLRDVRFVPLAEVPRLTLYPAIGDRLLRFIRGAQPGEPVYLGNLWTERD